MHDGYSRGGEGHPNIHPLALTGEEKADLVAFLRSLSDRTFLEDPRFRPER